MSQARSVTDADFDVEVLQSDKPVLVDFWAEWCPPCKALSPLIDELAAEMGDKLKIVKLNIDESPNTPTKYGVRGIPTLMVFKNGELATTRVGGMPKADLTNFVQSAL